MRVWRGWVLSVLGGAALGFGATAGAAPLELENAAQNVNRNADGSNPANYYGEWPGHSYFPSADDWRKVSVYQFITDRFADGTPENNEGRYGGYDLRNVGMRHGGDFKGVAQHLDYIKSLGYNAIWISPIFQNRYGDYHGYSQVDFTLLDDRMGTLDEMREMVNEAHARGIYVIVDIIVNHLSNLYYFEGYRNSAAPFKMHQGEYKLLPFNANETYRDFGVNNTFFTEGNYPEVFNQYGYPVYDTWSSGSYWASDFHHNGNLYSYDDPWANHLGKIYNSLDDLRTTHPRVQDKIIAMTKALVSSTDIDGIRMDTPMQVPLNFFQRWAPAVRAHAASLGKQDFLLFGEFYCSRERASTMTGRGKTPSMYGQENYINWNARTMHGGIDYPVYWWFNDAVKDQKDGNLGGLKSLYESARSNFDFWNPARNEHRYAHLNFYNNHDQWRMASATDGFQKTDLGSAIIAFWPGMPLFYYGDEQGFKTNGTALDGWSRESMMHDVAWDNLPTVDGKNPAQGDNFNMTNPHYLWVQKLMNIRRQYPALQSTDLVTERWKQANSANGVYAYTRVWGDQKNWALVAWNTWKQSVKAGGNLGAFYTGWNQGDTIVNVFNPNERYTLGPGGTLGELWVDGYGIKVFVRQDNLKPLDPVVTWVTPSHDQRVTANDWVVRVKFSEDMDVDSVKAAFRYDDQAVPAHLLTWVASDRRIEYAITPTDGFHTVKILEGAKSTAGKHLFGVFNATFRKGADHNVMANRAFNNDPGMIQVLSEANGSVNLLHKAVGAQKLRVRNSGGAWSPWQPYAATTAWNVGSGSGVKKVDVQYWAKNSAAYFVSSEVTLGGGGLPQLYFRGTPNGFGNLPMLNVADRQWQIDVTFGNTANERFKLDVYGDWAQNYGDTQRDGVADLFGTDIPVTQGAGTYRIWFNDQTKAYTVTKQGFAKSYNQVYFRGTPNGFGILAMSLVADNTWEVSVTFGNTTNERFKFDIHGDWSLNFGDTNRDGVCEQAGADIPIAAGRQATIRFNDLTKRYTIN
jgi:alpha-1,3-glucan synthase